MSLRSFRRLCGKCASAHTCVMWCFSQVLEASFHCVTFWHHPGLPAPPSAAMRRPVTDDQADPELLQVCLSFVAMKTNGNEDAVAWYAVLISRSFVYMDTLPIWGCSVYALRSIYFYMFRSKNQFRPEGTSIQFLAEHVHHHIMFCWLILLQTGFDCI